MKEILGVTGSLMSHLDGGEDPGSTWKKLEQYIAYRFIYMFITIYTCVEFSFVSL